MVWLCDASDPASCCASGTMSLSITSCKGRGSLLTLLLLLAGTRGGQLFPGTVDSIVMVFVSWQCDIVDVVQCVDLAMAVGHT